MLRASTGASASCIPRLPRPEPARAHARATRRVTDAAGPQGPAASCRSGGFEHGPVQDPTRAASPRTHCPDRRAARWALTIRSRDDLAPSPARRSRGVRARPGPFRCAHGACTADCPASSPHRTPPRHSAGVHPCCVAPSSARRASNRGLAGPATRRVESKRSSAQPVVGDRDLARAGARAASRTATLVRTADRPCTSC
jgi:hypothetical protein